MKHIILLFAFLTAGSAIAQPRACGCFELDRRARGLDFASRYAQGYDQQDLQRSAYESQDVLSRSQSYPTYQQENICSQQNQRVDYQWRRWQPFVAQHGADIGNPCE